MTCIKHFIAGIGHRRWRPEDAFGMVFKTRLSPFDAKVTTPNALSSIQVTTMVMVRATIVALMVTVTTIQYAVAANSDMNQDPRPASRLIFIANRWINSTVMWEGCSLMLCAPKYKLQNLWIVLKGFSTFDIALEHTHHTTPRSYRSVALDRIIACYSTRTCDMNLNECLIADVFLVGCRAYGRSCVCVCICSCVLKACVSSQLNKHQEAIFRVFFF